MPFAPVAVSAYLFAFRIVHISFAIAWGGSAFVFFTFIEPTAATLGPQGRPFMAEMMGRRRLPIVINSIATVAVIAGGFLYWHDSSGFSLSWISSGPGIGFTIGAVAAIIAWLTGWVFLLPAAIRMGALGQELAQQGGPPSPDQATALHKLERTFAIGGRVDISMIALAALMMSFARYLPF